MSLKVHLQAWADLRSHYSQVFAQAWANRHVSYSLAHVAWQWLYAAIA